MTDPRPAAIAARLAGAQRILAVTGGKGGTGKSLVAACLALLQARRGLRTGLFDLDLTAPTAHLILGLEPGFPEEPFGVDPPLHHGVRLMSLALFGGARPAPLRGGERTDALLELLAITNWGPLDLLVLDLPPGLGDLKLDLLRLLPRTEYLAVGTPSPVVCATVERALALLRAVRAPVAGLLENLRRPGSPDRVRALAEKTGVPYLGALPYDGAVEEALGDPDRLAKTRFAAALDTLQV